MALTQGARNKIKSFVQDIKKKLSNEFQAQLLASYGFKDDGSYIYEEELPTTDTNTKEIAILLRKRLEYLKAGIAGEDNQLEAMHQLVREQAFTILNRFAALRLSEERNIIRPSINEGYNSKGFQVYDQLTGGAQSGDQFQRYKWYLNAVFDELATDLPAVFDRYSPYALMFPSEKVLLEILDVINDHELSIYREEGHQPINLWQEDETIGWIYQYYNSREEISAMREASGAPRNSRELAVRNQFFTPRYVVQFLTDNSLGQQWYEMCRGETALPDVCEYMVKHKQVVFLDEGIDPPKDRDEQIHYVQYRPLKDPRAILMLDPACGSMHFGLYCFDLYEIIYKEAWDNHPSLLQDLRDRWTRVEFIKQIPGLIIRYNIHGVDIDPRAIQIAGLSLWLRAQRYYDELNLQPADRPNINKSNLVVAEPLPGDTKMLSEFSQSLPGPIGKLLRVIWEKMKLAGETGLLLKIEEELKAEIEIAKTEWEAYKDASAQTELFAVPEKSKAAEMAAIYGQGQKISKDFFDTAEEQVLGALQSFSENAQGENAFSKLLFAEDTARGFGFIELCRKRYDVILMNPPFGASSQNAKYYIDAEFTQSKYDLASVFIDRMLQLLNRKGSVSSISTRTIFFLGYHTKWRSYDLFNNNEILYFADFGEGVLDATVETACYIISKGFSNLKSRFYRIIDENEKQHSLKKLINSNKSYYLKDSRLFKQIPKEPLCYWVDDRSIQFFQNNLRFDEVHVGAKSGLKTFNNERFLINHYEINQLDNQKWNFFIFSDSSSRFYVDIQVCVKWNNNGSELRAFTHQKNRSIEGENSFYHPGLSWARRTSTFSPHIIPNDVISSASRFIAIFSNESSILENLTLWNSKYYDYLLKLSMEWISRPIFKNGNVNALPQPKIDKSLKIKLLEIAKQQHSRVQSNFSIDDKSLSFNKNDFVSTESLSDFVSRRVKKLIKFKEDYLEKLDSLNDLIFNYFKVSESEQKIIVELCPSKNEGKIFDQNDVGIFLQIFQILLGCAFGRWDLTILNFWKNDWNDENILKARSHSPFLRGPKESTLDLLLSEYHDEIKRIWQLPYPIEVLEEASTIDQIEDKLEEVIKYFWEENSGKILSELEEHYNVSSLADLFTKHNQFFDNHLKDYSRNKRISPIYWHLSIPSGKFVLWFYYPSLNDQSLYKANKLVEDKIKIVKEEIEKLEVGGSSTALTEQKELYGELQNFSEEILRVAKFYKPNQDDGVLITAAPLHNLFRHSKWKKATEACWKKLEKGEYDWAHLAYSIWPDRVREKCKKDLSMAIAHGLEDICEVKPKEKKTRKKKGVKIEEQQKLL